MIICTKRSNNGNKIAIMVKSCGQYQQTEAEDGKLKSNLGGLNNINLPLIKVVTVKNPTVIFYT